MPVYVDDMKAKFGRYTMCHMIADTDEELHEMASKLGLKGIYFQYPGSHKRHYDIALSKRALAVQLGAIEITWRQTSAMCARRRETGELGDPAEALDWYLNRKKPS